MIYTMHTSLAYYQGNMIKEELFWISTKARCTKIFRVVPLFTDEARGTRIRHPAHFEVNWDEEAYFEAKPPLVDMTWNFNVYEFFLTHIKIRHPQSTCMTIWCPWKFNFTFLTLQIVKSGKAFWENASLDIYRHENTRNQIISTML